MDVLSYYVTIVLDMENQNGIPVETETGPTLLENCYDIQDSG